MNDKTNELLTQIRTAHRLLAAYYQRLLPAIEQIAHEANTEFYFWTPTKFNKPGKNPFKKWQWDLLPAVIARYVFKHVNDLSKVTKNDYIIEFIVISDTGINDEKSNTQPDALDLNVTVDDAQSILQISIYRATEDVKNGFYDEWESGRYPNYKSDVGIELDNKFIKYGFEVPISSLMSESGAVSIKETIMTYLAETEQMVLSQQYELKK